MITNYYTLRALVEEWETMLAGSVLGDAFSQEPDELTLAFTAAANEQMIRIGIRRPFQFMFRIDGYSKARRNVATLFDEAFDRNVESLRIAERDRMIFINLGGGMTFRIPLYGPRANVLLVSDDQITTAFQGAAELSGARPPEPRPAPSPKSLDAFEARWRRDRKTVAHAVSSACPLFDRILGAEVAVRAGVDPEGPADVGPGVLQTLIEAVRTVRESLLYPEPRIYWDGDDPVFFSLLPLRQAGGLSEERFDSVDEAARVFVRRSLARRRFRELYNPLERALEQAAAHYCSSAERMEDELSRESRADEYEKWGHLLMARANDISTGADEARLEDLFSHNETITVPLDPSRSAIDNARRYYDRARRARRSREEAERRLEETRKRAREASQLLDALRQADGLQAIRSFRTDHAGELARFLPDEERPGERIPFRRFDLSGGYQVWVGRNARQNDALTFHHAQKYDLWMHARGVPGSHAVLRLPNRDAEPGRAIVQQAASIAAYFSKARGSGLVPVMVAERKYVRKPKGAPPGAVAVEREDVVLVEPRLPG